MSFSRLQNFMENEQKSKEDAIHIALYSASKNNDYFPFLLRICRNIVFIEILILFGLRSFMIQWDDDDGPIMDISNICEQMPLFSAFLIISSIGETLCLVIAFVSYLGTERKYLYRKNWKFTLVLMLHHFNTVPIFMSLSLIFGSTSSTGVKIISIICSLISLIINYSVQYILYWLSYGFARKPPIVPEYYRYNFPFYYCCLAGITVFFCFFTMKIHLAMRIMSISACLIITVLFFLQGKVNIVSFKSKTHNFSIGIALVFIIEVLVNILSFSNIFSGKMNLAILATLIPVTYAIEVEITKQKYYKNNQNMKEVLKMNDFLTYFSKTDVEQIGKAVAINLDYIKDYKFINAAIGFYKPSFALFEAEFIIAEKKGDSIRMQTAYDRMKSINRLTSLEKARLFSYRMNLLAFNGDESDPVINDCKYFLRRYILSISKFWNSVVFDNIDRLVANSNDIKTSFHTLRTIFELYGKDGPLKDYYDCFNSVCTINENSDTKIKFNIESHFEPFKKQVMISDFIFIFLQVLIGIIVFIVFSAMIVINFREIRNGWNLIIDYSTIAENLQGLFIVSAVIHQKLNYSIYANKIYDDSIFKTKLMNVTADAEYLINEIEDAIDKTKEAFTKFKYSESLNSVFFKPINYTTVPGKSVNISFLSSLLFKEIELSDIVNNVQKLYFSKTWDNTSINSICLETICQIAEEIREKLYSVMNKQNYAINSILGVYIIICFAIAIANPVISTSIIKKFFNSLFCLSKLELKNFSEKLSNDMNMNDSEDDHYELDEVERENYRNMSFFRGKLRAKEYKSGITGFFIKHLTISIIATLILFVFLNSYIHGSTRRVSSIIEVLSFTKYTFYLPSIVLDIGYKFIDVYTEQSYEKHRKDLVNVLGQTTKMFSEETIDIVHFSHDLIDDELYIANTNNSKTNNPSFTNMALSFIISALEYLETDNYDFPHIKYTMQLCLETASYYIPKLKESLSQNLDIYFKNCIRESCFIANLLIMMFLLIVIFSSNCVNLQPKPEDISWGAIATIPSGVWDDFNEIIDPQMSNKDTKSIAKELSSLFQDNTILNKVTTPICILDKDLRTLYLNQSAIEILEKDSVSYKGEYIKDLIKNTVKNIPKIGRIPYQANFVEGSKNKNRFYIQLTETKDNTVVFTIRNETKEYMIHKQYINNINMINILLATKVSHLDVKCNDIDIYRMETRKSVPYIISTWYIGYIPNPQCSNDIISIINDVLSKDRDVWFSGRSVTTFKLYFREKNDYRHDYDFKAIKICSIIMKRLRKLNIHPYCYLTKSEDRRISFIYGEYLLYETIDESSNMFLIALSCCEKCGIFVSREIYEDLYNNREIEFVFQATFSKEMVYKVVTDLANIAHTTIRRPSSEIITTMLSKMLKEPKHQMNDSILL